LDVSSFSSIQKFVSEVKEEFPTVHCLINNAGALLPTYEERNGLEMTMLTNYYGPLYLTTQLLPVLRQAGGSGRVVNVSSRLEKTHTWTEAQIRSGPTGLLRPADAEKYSYMTQYGNSKFLQLLATLGQGEAYKREGVVVHAVTPGMVRTGLAGQVLWAPLALLSQPVQMLFLRTPEQGAAPVVYAATAALPGECTGKYWQADKAGRCSEEQVGRSELSRSLSLATALLRSSDELISSAIAHEMKKGK